MTPCTNSRHFTLVLHFPPYITCQKQVITLVGYFRIAFDILVASLYVQGAGVRAFPIRFTQLFFSELLDTFELFIKIACLEAACDPFDFHGYQRSHA